MNKKKVIKFKSEILNFFKNRSSSEKYMKFKNNKNIRLLKKFYFKGNLIIIIGEKYQFWFCLTQSIIVSN